MQDFTFLEADWGGWRWWYLLNKILARTHTQWSASWAKKCLIFRNRTRNLRNFVVHLGTGSGDETAGVWIMADWDGFFFVVGAVVAFVSRTRLISTWWMRRSRVLLPVRLCTGSCWVLQCTLMCQQNCTWSGLPFLGFVACWKQIKMKLKVLKFCSN